MENEISGKAKGGKARAAALSPEKRKEIAIKAARTRWDTTLLQATHEGEFPIGDSSLSCANLQGGQRIITQATFLRAIGRSRSPKAGTGVLSTVDGLPFFLQAKVLKPFINKELEESTAPFFYRTMKGGKGVGYDATLLPKVAEVYLRFRDEHRTKDGGMPKRYKRQYEHIIDAADILMRGLAHVGIIALVDEATGYQKDRDRDDLAGILQLFVAKELQPWLKTFSHEFYVQMFRLRGLPLPINSVRRPQYFGHLTNDIIYRRLAPGVWEELKRQAEKDTKGRTRHRLHSRLTPDIGHPQLRDLVASVTTIMKLSREWGDFKEKLDLIHPAYNETMKLPFELMYDGGKGLG